MHDMKQAVALVLISGFSVSAQAVSIDTGETFSYDFTEMSYVQEAEPGVFYDFASISYHSRTVSIDPGAPINHDFRGELRLYEENDPASAPFYSVFFDQTSSSMGVVGINWPTDTWMDFDGLIEVEILEGAIFLDAINVTVEQNNSLYSAGYSPWTRYSPVPLPGSFWLLMAGLGGIGFFRNIDKSQHRQA
jgi:hypothetical protein